MQLFTWCAIALLAACTPNRREDPPGGDAGECPNGDCGYTCAQAALDHNYVGCEYWPVDLDNAIEIIAAPNPLGGCISPWKKKETDVCWDTVAPHGSCDGGCPGGTTCENHVVCALDAQHSPFAIVVSNPDPEKSVTATLSNAAGMTIDVVIAPAAVQTIFPQQLGFPDASIEGAGIAANAYHLVTDRPIIAYQFNPLDDVGVFSNDASLLIPAQTYDTEYLVMTYETLLRRPQTNDYHGYATVVGIGPGPTTVTVTPTADVMPGPGLAAVTARTVQSFTVQPFETLNLQAVGVRPGGDLTGTQITCSQPCGVFVGHEATTIAPAQQPRCCADHLEEQVFPTSTWGRTYALASSTKRSVTQPDMFRVMAQRPNTQLTFSSPQGGCPATLGRGEYCDVSFDGDLVVSATEPILVGHFLASTGGVGDDSGDPSLAFPAPVEQFRTDYALLVPSKYKANYINVVTPIGGQVFVDGIEMIGLQPFGNQFQAARLAVTPGYHHLTCPGRCGVEVYGWSNAVSYFFAGGLDLVPQLE